MDNCIRPKAIAEIVMYLVVFEYSKLDLLLLVLVLFGGGVILLLPFLGSTTEAKHQVKGTFLLDIVIGQGTSIFQLFASEDQTLLVGGNSYTKGKYLELVTLLTLPFPVTRLGK